MANFCEYLLKRGRITGAELARARSETDAHNLVIGQCAYAFGFLDEGHIVRVLGIQRRSGQKFGEIAVALGYITRGQLTTVLKIQDKYRMAVEEALINEGILSREELEAEQRAFEGASTAPSFD